MRQTQKATKNIGVYAVYYNLKEEKGGYEMEHIVLPDSDDTPDTVKLAILQSLLNDFNIPFTVDTRLTWNTKNKT